MSDHPQIFGEWEKLFRGRDELKIARQRVANKMGTKWRTSASFLACSGWFQGVIGGVHARSMGPVCVHGSSCRIICIQRLGNWEVKRPRPFCLFMISRPGAWGALVSKKKKSQQAIIVCVRICKLRFWNELIVLTGMSSSGFHKIIMLPFRAPGAPKFWKFQWNNHNNSKLARKKNCWTIFCAFEPSIVAT